MLKGKLWHLEVSPRGQSTETEACELFMMMVMVTVVLVVGTDFDDADDGGIKSILCKRKVQDQIDSDGSE